MNDPLEQGYEVVDEASAEKSGETIYARYLRRRAELTGVGWTIGACTCLDNGDFEIRYYRRKSKVQA